MEPDGSKSNDSPPSSQGEPRPPTEISVAPAVTAPAVVPPESPPPPVSAPLPPAFSPRLAWVLVVMVILFVGFVRLRLLDFPLERDEGEYAYAGQLILQGIPPYELAYNMKLPGTYVAYAALMAIFGQTTAGVHLGLLAVNAASIILVFLLGRRLFDDMAGVVAAASYGMMSISPTVLGLAAHATHFVVLPMLGAVLCLLRASATGRQSAYFFSGILFGLAFLMKQQGVFFGIFGGFWIVWCALRVPVIEWTRLGERILLFSLGCALPFLLTCILLALFGVFQMFWFWTFDYARAYVNAVPLAVGMDLLLNQVRFIGLPFWPLGLLAVVGLFLLWWRRPAPGQETFISAFFAFSFLTVCPGFYFREHYFITLLPAVTLLVGAGVSLLRQRIYAASLPAGWRCLPVGLIVAALVFAACVHRFVFFVLDTDAACRRIYGDNPFVEAREIARYIEEHSAKDARVAVVGSEPEIYFYSRRHSASGFIYTYPLVEAHRFAGGMQKQMAEEIEAAKPDFFVYVNVPMSWLVQKGSPNAIFDWSTAYCREHYQIVGVVDMAPPAAPVFKWDRAAEGYFPRTSMHVLVLKRKPEN